MNRIWCISHNHPLTAKQVGNFLVSIIRSLPGNQTADLKIFRAINYPKQLLPASSLSLDCFKYIYICIGDNQRTVRLYLFRVPGQISATSIMLERSPLQWHNLTNLSNLFITAYYYLPNLLPQTLSLPCWGNSSWMIMKSVHVIPRTTFEWSYCNPLDSHQILMFIAAQSPFQSHPNFSKQPTWSFFRLFS